MSVLLPAWNAASTLRLCLASLSRQSLVDWECVLLDDGSTDETAAIAADYARRDPRLRLVSRPRGGIVAALNAGLLHCRAPLVARMDADDLMHHDRLAAQVSALEQDATLAAVGCHVRLFPRAHVSPRMREYEAWLNSLGSADSVARDAFVESPVAHPTWMMRREVAQLGYRDAGWPEDYDLILRALAAGNRIGVVRRRLLAWRHQPDSLSRRDERYSLPRFTDCRAHYLAAGFLADVDRYVLWGYGRTGRELRRALAELGKTPSHIVEVMPTRIGNTIHGAPVVAIDALPALAPRPIVVSVARAGPRAEIRAALAAMGFVDGIDYVCAA